MTWAMEPDGEVYDLGKPPGNWVGPQRQWELDCLYYKPEDAGELMDVTGASRPISRLASGHWVFTDALVMGELE